MFHGLQIEFENKSDCAFVLLSAKDADAVPFHLEENGLLGPAASDKRRADFLLGRKAARLALAKLGLENPPAILKGSRGEPLWPGGYVGSITHFSGFGTALVCRTGAFSGAGIDLQEIGGERNGDLRRRISTEKEYEWLDGMRDPNEQRKNFISLFSAKESVFKAFYPLSRIVLGFKDVELKWLPKRNGFSGELLVTIPPRFEKGFKFFVEVRVDAGFVFTFLLL